MNWNEGYRTDLLYTYGYFQELNPAYVRFMLLCNGFAVPNSINNRRVEGAYATNFYTVANLAMARA